MGTGPTGPLGTGPTGTTGITGRTGPTGPCCTGATGAASTVTGPTGPATAVSALTIYSTADLSALTLPTGIASTLVTIPDATYISITGNNGTNRFICNMTGGVQGRLVIFIYDPDTAGNEYIQFNDTYAVSGTGISIGLSRLTNNVAIGGGGTISFVFWNNYWRQA